MPGKGNAPVVPGNVLRLQAGARSPRTVEPVAREIADALLAAAPYLADPKWRGAVEALAVTEARLRLLDAFINERGLVTRKGRPLATADYAFRLERLADGLRTSLGLTPSSAAMLGKAVSATELDLARLWSGQGTPPTDAVAGREADAPPAPEPTPAADGQSAAAGVTAPADGDDR